MCCAQRVADPPELRTGTCCGGKPGKCALVTVELLLRKCTAIGRRLRLRRLLLRRLLLRRRLLAFILIALPECPGGTSGLPGEGCILIARVQNGIAG
jgi:hypothetical protein